MSDDSAAEPIRRRIIYHGRVQGVFFRATCHAIAADYAVVGFVRNLPDGTVELEAEGQAEQVRAFLRAVAQRYQGSITDTQESEQALRSSEARFEVRYEA